MGEEKVIRKIGKNKKYPEDYIDDVIKTFKRVSAPLRREYPDVAKYYDGIFGVPVSQSMHPAGIIVYPDTINLYEDYGVFECADKKSDIPKRVLALDMEDCHEISLVKYDILGLKQVQINRICCEEAELRDALAHEIDWEDQIV